MIERPEYDKREAALAGLMEGTFAHAENLGGMGTETALAGPGDSIIVTTSSWLALSKSPI